MNYNIKYAFVNENSTILEAMQIIELSPRQGGPSGIAIAVTADKKFIGILTDGDIRGLILKKVSLDATISNYINRKPLTINEDDLDRTPFNSLISKLNKLRHDKNLKSYQSLFDLNNIIVLNKDSIAGVLSPYDFMEGKNMLARKVSVIGLGYVGLTLATVLADEGFFIKGVDPAEHIHTSLGKGNAHFYEIGIDHLIKRYYGNRLTSSRIIEDSLSDVYIVAVGTPVDDKGTPLLHDVEKACEKIAEHLKAGDLIILRSTLPIGACRNKFLKIFEEKSKLKCGYDFHLVFAPERTVEGKALNELRTLPQIIGGFSSRCTQLASDFFGIFAPTIVRVESLEAAEMVKLLNNSFRDVSFGFANQISMLCESIGIDTVSVIQAANEGYPRNPIPVPSPGVGGICLKKDPYILCESANQYNLDLSIVKEARNINEYMPEFVSNIIHNYISKHGTKKDKIFIIGIAFKGQPETSDIRNSTALELIKLLKEFELSIKK